MSIFSKSENPELAAMNARMAARRAEKNAAKPPPEQREISDEEREMLAQGYELIFDIWELMSTCCRYNGNSYPTYHEKLKQHEIEFISDLGDRMGEGWYTEHAEHQEYTVTVSQYKWLLALAIRCGFDHKNAKQGWGQLRPPNPDGERTDEYYDGY